MKGVIDLSKPIHPAIESQIFKYLEVEDILSVLQTSPNVDKGTLVYTPYDWITTLKRCILPWWVTSDQNTKDDDEPTMSELIAALQELNKKDNVEHDRTVTTTNTTSDN